MRLSNYPPGVSGNEPQIAGYDEDDEGDEATPNPPQPPKLCKASGRRIGARFLNERACIWCPVCESEVYADRHASQAEKWPYDPRVRWTIGEHNSQPIYTIPKG